MTGGGCHVCKQTWRASLGFVPLQRMEVPEVYWLGVPRPRFVPLSAFLTLSGVCSLQHPCGLIPSHWRSWGSSNKTHLLRGLPRGSRSRSMQPTRDGKPEGYRFRAAGLGRLRRVASPDVWPHRARIEPRGRPLMSGRQARRGGKDLVAVPAHPSKQRRRSCRQAGCPSPGSGGNASAPSEAGQAGLRFSIMDPEGPCFSGQVAGGCLA
jgi:hypothetical protein